MNKKKKNLSIGFIAIFCFSLFLIYSFIIFPKSQASINEDIENGRVKQFQVSNITVIIDYAGVKDNDFFFNINLTNYETTVYHALLNCSNVSIQDYDWGLYVKEINGVGVGWTYTVNNAPLPNIPCDYFYLIDDDIIRWTHV